MTEPTSTGLDPMYAIHELVGDALYEHYDRMGLSSGLTRPYAAAGAVTEALGPLIAERDALAAEVQRLKRVLDEAGRREMAEVAERDRLWKHRQQLEAELTAALEELIPDGNGATT